MYVSKLRIEIAKEATRTAEKQQAIENYTKTIESALSELKQAEKASSLVQTVAQNTQGKLEYRISSLVSHALATIFDDPYTFKLEFVKKRGKVEAELLFEKEGHTFNPMDSSGGGVLDIASFALRLAFWGLGGSSPVIILDEPSKHLSADKQARYCELLKALQSKLNVQFIIVTHMDKLQQSADSVTEVLDGNIVTKLEV